MSESRVADLLGKSQWQLFSAVEAATPKTIGENLTRLASRAIAVLKNHGFDSAIYEALVDEPGRFLATIALASREFVLSIDAGAEAECASDVLIALMRIAYADDSTDAGSPAHTARLMTAALFVGHAEAQLAQASSGGAYSVIAALEAEKDGAEEERSSRLRTLSQAGTTARQKSAADNWQPLIADFLEARERNPRITPNGWCQQYAGRYLDKLGQPLKADTARKVLKQRVSGTSEK